MKVCESSGRRRLLLLGQSPGRVLPLEPPVFRVPSVSIATGTYDIQQLERGRGSHPRDPYIGPPARTAEADAERESSGTTWRADRYSGPNPWFHENEVLAIPRTGETNGRTLCPGPCGRLGNGPVGPWGFKPSFQRRSRPTHHGRIPWTRCRTDELLDFRISGSTARLFDFGLIPCRERETFELRPRSGGAGSTDRPRRSGRDRWDTLTSTDSIMGGARPLVPVPWARRTTTDGLPPARRCWFSA